LSDGMDRLPLDVLRVVYAKSGVRGRALLASASAQVRRNLWYSTDERLLLAAYAHRKGHLTDIPPDLAAMLFKNRGMAEIAEILKSHATSPHVRSCALKAAIASMDYSDVPQMSDDDVYACSNDLQTFVGTLTPAQFDAFRANLSGRFADLSATYMDKGSILQRCNMALLAHVIWRVREGALWPEMRDMLDSYVTRRNVLAMISVPDIPDEAWTAMLAVAIAHGKADVAKAIFAAGHTL
jgi:hypothetical protein